MLRGGKSSQRWAGAVVVKFTLEHDIDFRCQANFRAIRYFKRQANERVIIRFLIQIRVIWKLKVEECLNR